MTIINPEITCTDPDDGVEPEEGYRTPTQEDDIDQAFASYEREHPSGQTKTLQEQLNILAMVRKNYMDTCILILSLRRSQQ